MNDHLRFRIPEQLLLPWSPKHTISVARAAELLKCSEDTVLRMIKSDELKGYQLRKKRKGSPFRVYYDSVVRLAEDIHDDVNMEKRF
jgi:excisionase family DNA binding protein